MNNRLILSGNTTRIREFVKFLSIIDYPIEVLSLNNKLENFFNEFLTLNICNNFKILNTPVDNFENFDAILYLYDFPENVDNIEFLKDKVSNFRLLINDAIEKGFDGKILINGYHDDVITYFANKFTGKSFHNIIGLGTLPNTLIVKNILKNYFNVNYSDISISTLGNNACNVISWSRSYIGQSPILSYLSDKNNLFKDEIREQISGDLADGKTIKDDVLNFKSIIIIIDALYHKKPTILDLTNLSKVNNAIEVFSSPVFINEKGIFKYITFSLSDNEKDFLDHSVEQSKNIINKVMQK
ncbi:hypothetical protein MOO46_02755 [Apilactobacillus apisilvae]|uniref:Lactate dehydrogenase n=1 Tax=Apilactobacillus apisilvae TaxID=2923364 RepID=A0ABY4PIR5_9LACO|nr:hypothetical protein [Apilactobacillus apisilvae]UQS85523.1 hypothetical protein MOO46_02755 [Apilactobacillus apisilvae]